MKLLAEVTCGEKEFSGQMPFGVNGLNNVKQNSLLQILSKPLYSSVLLPNYIKLNRIYQIYMDTKVFFCVEHL